uniref:Uncharacterized protein n=1 Tax=Clandestinovirus TaxID=2831644 RepID=A0A8F8KLB4_9VIRU|nr:hypothetical protein KOM_12_525 [Clandestinovirus]
MLSTIKLSSRLAKRFYTTSAIKSGLNVNIGRDAIKKSFVKEEHAADYKVLRIMTVGVNPLNLVDVKSLGRQNDVPYLVGQETKQIVPEEELRNLVNTTHPVYQRLHVGSTDFLYYPEIAHPLLGYAMTTRCKGKTSWSHPLKLSNWTTKNPYKYTLFSNPDDKPHVVIVNHRYKCDVFQDVPVLQCNEHPCADELEHLNKSIENVIGSSLFNKVSDQIFNRGYAFGIIVGAVYVGLVFVK